MQFGRYYEEFEVGAVYKHWPGKTVTEYDDHLFCLLTMNHHPLHMDVNYAEKTTDFGKNVVVGNYIYSLLLGMSVPDVSGKAIANLEVESLRHVAPTFHGDTIYGETTVLDKTESKSKDDRGVVYVETIGYKQDGTVVCIFRRKVMVPKRSYGEARGGEQPGPARAHPALTAARSAGDRSGGEDPPRRGGSRPGAACRAARPGWRRRRTGLLGVVARHGFRVGADERAGQVEDVEHDAVRPGIAPDRPRARARTSRPVSSRTSRTTACSGDSPGLDPAPGQRPQPAVRVVAAPDQQQPAGRVVDHRADARHHPWRTAWPAAGGGACAARYAARERCHANRVVAVPTAPA